MKIFIKKINDDGNIEISAFKNINAGNDFDSLLYPPEDVCIKSEEINIFDLLEENKKLKKENDILLNVQEDAEKSLHKIRELKKELNKVNDENKRLKEQIDVYENPEDMFLMMMWCTEEVKDENKKLKEALDEIEKYLKNDIESCNSALSNPEYTIINKHELLRNEKQKVVDILKIIQKNKRRC